MSLRIEKHGLYLNRTGRTVGIVQDRGERQTWRWLTTRGHYVLADGRAALVGESVEDLVKDVTPSIESVRGMDSIAAPL